MRPNRILAVVTALAVGWTSLWPLVAAARALAAAEHEPLCHQAGTQVAPDRAPLGPAAPGGPGEPRQHCPLCVFAFLGAFAAAPGVVPPAFVAHAPAVPVALAPPRAGLEVALPQGRAPPSSPR